VAPGKENISSAALDYMRDVWHHHRLHQTQGYFVCYNMRPTKKHCIQGPSGFCISRLRREKGKDLDMHSAGRKCQDAADRFAPALSHGDLGTLKNLNAP